MNPLPSKPATAFLLVQLCKRLVLFFSFCFIVNTSFGQLEEGSSKEEEVKVEKSPSANANKVIYGLASFYAQKFHGRMTANGEIFSHQQFTAACNVLPLGTWVQVTNLKNGKIIVVKTNDRLHPNTRRIIDLTYAGASKLGFIKNGLTRVKIEILNQKKYKKPWKN